jgi:hypothetical protein
MNLPDGNGYRVLVVGQRLYLVAFGGKRLLGVDISDPTHAVMVTDLNAPSVQIDGKTVSLAIQDRGGNGAPGLAFRAGYLYVTTGAFADNAPTAQPYALIFDVSNPNVIRPAGALSVTDRRGWQYFCQDLTIEGSRLYVSDYGSQMVFDLSDPLRPALLDRYARSYSQQIGTVRSGFLYVPKLDGLEILRVPD